MAHPKLRENWRNRSQAEFIIDVASYLCEYLAEETGKTWDFVFLSDNDRRIITVEYDDQNFAWHAAAKLWQIWIDTGVINVNDTAIDRAMPAPGDFRSFDDDDNCDDDCRGWDGRTHRCDCGARRMYWDVDGGFAYPTAY